MKLCKSMQYLLSRFVCISNQDLHIRQSALNVKKTHGIKFTAYSEHLSDDQSCDQSQPTKSFSFHPSFIEILLLT